MPKPILPSLALDAEDSEKLRGELENGASDAEMELRTERARARMEQFLPARPSL